MNKMGDFNKTDSISGMKIYFLRFYARFHSNDFIIAFIDEELKHSVYNLLRTHEYIDDLEFIQKNIVSADEVSYKLENGKRLSKSKLFTNYKLESRVYELLSTLSKISLTEEYIQDSDLDDDDTIQNEIPENEVENLYKEYRNSLESMAVSIPQSNTSEHLAIRVLLEYFNSKSEISE